jgi:hypothetical protein
MVATTPLVTSWRSNWRNDQHASGMPAVRGLSNARRFDLNDDAVGKACCALAWWLFVQAGQALVEEPLPPVAHDLALKAEVRGDDVVPEAVGGPENNLDAHDVAVRKRILGRSPIVISSFSNVTLK